MDDPDDRMVETIPLPGVRQDDGPGVGPPVLTACSYDHALEIQAFIPQHHGIDPVRRRLLPPERVHFCAHCSWCGVIVAKSDHCLLHPEGCPNVMLERTVLITDAAGWIALNLQAAGFKRICPDSLFDILVEEAGTRLVFYQARGGTYLGALVLRKAGFPEPPPEPDDPFHLPNDPGADPF